MKSALFAFVLSLTALNSHAADSTWLLCDNGSLAMNLLEHRNGADGRATDLALIYGTHILKGQLIDVDAGPVALDGSEASAVKTFKGSVSVNYVKNTVSLRGVLSLYGSPSRVSAVLKCKVMKN